MRNDLAGLSRRVGGQSRSLRSARATWRVPHTLTAMPSSSLKPSCVVTHSPVSLTQAASIQRSFAWPCQVRLHLVRSPGSQDFGAEINEPFAASPAPKRTAGFELVLDGLTTMLEVHAPRDHRNSLLEKAIYKRINVNTFLL